MVRPVSPCRLSHDRGRRRPHASWAIAGAIAGTADRGNAWAIARAIAGTVGWPVARAVIGPADSPPAVIQRLRSRGAEQNLRLLLVAFELFDASLPDLLVLFVEEPRVEEGVDVVFTSFRVTLEHVVLDAFQDLCGVLPELIGNEIDEVAVDFIPRHRLPRLFGDDFLLASLCLLRLLL